MPKRSQPLPNPLDQAYPDGYRPPHERLLLRRQALEQPKEIPANETLPLGAGSIPVPAETPPKVGATEEPKAEVKMPSAHESEKGTLRPATPKRQEEVPIPIPGTPPAEFLKSRIRHWLENPAPKNRRLGYYLPLHSIDEMAIVKRETKLTYEKQLNLALEYYFYLIDQKQDIPKRRRPAKETKLPFLKGDALISIPDDHRQMNFAILPALQEKLEELSLKWDTPRSAIVREAVEALMATLFHNNEASGQKR